MLLDLRIDASRGRLYAPLDALRLAGLDGIAFDHGDTSATVRSFLNDWRTRVRVHLDGLGSLLGTPGLRRTHRHGLVLAALHLRMLDRLEARSARDAGRLDLEPLARLWTAWRTAVRHA
jgi:phytoene/squalene synthetase